MRFLASSQSFCLWTGLLLACLAATPVRAALFYSRQTFELGTQDTTTISFDGLASPPANYASYPAGLVLAGVEFAGQAPGEPATPSLFVIDPLYHADYDRGSGDVLSPGTADGWLTIELPAGVQAVGFDIATFGAPGENRAQVVASSGGPDPMLSFGSALGPETGRAFVGFTSTTPIARLTIHPNAFGVVLIDNLRFGQPSLALTPGDANGDGLVNGADYTLWADNFLEVARSFDLGDFNGDGIVDAGDYTLWADNFAPSDLLAAATPEPSTNLLLAIGAGVILVATWARRIRSQSRIASR